MLFRSGQTKLNLASKGSGENQSDALRRLNRNGNKLKVIKASADELAQHESRLDIVEKAGGKCLWRPEQNDA